MSTELAEIRMFLHKAIASLEIEINAYDGFLKLIDNQDEIDPVTAKMLLDLAKKDNRFMGR